MAVIKASMQANPTTSVSRRRGRQRGRVDKTFSMCREDPGGTHVSSVRSALGCALSDRNPLNIAPLGPGAKLHPILSPAAFGILSLLFQPSCASTPATFAAGQIGSRGTGITNVRRYLLNEIHHWQHEERTSEFMPPYNNVLSSCAGMRSRQSR